MKFVGLLCFSGIDGSFYCYQALASFDSSGFDFSLLCSYALGEWLGFVEIGGDDVNFDEFESIDLLCLGLLLLFCFFVGLLAAICLIW